MRPIFRTVQVLDLLLNRDNPRHIHKESQDQIIKYLLSSEEVYNLARHMAQHGINPLEVVAVYPDDDGNLTAAEGNRRVCAAQLLTDPEKAPESDRARFRALAKKAVDVSEINIVEFRDYETAQPWLQVLHDGEQDGIGRRRWKPEQKARATTNKSNDALAVAILDFAEKNGLIEDEARRTIRVSTATRYMANPAVRKAMGLASGATSDKIEITSDLSRFQSAVSYFLEGIISKRLHSRSVTKDWLGFAAELEQTFGDPGSGPTASVSSTPIRKKSARPARVKIVVPDTRLIAKSDPLVRSLNALGSYKLSSLYHSLVTLYLDEHPVLLTTGAWVFVETLAALHGKADGAEFKAYISSQLPRWALPRDKARDCNLSLTYISEHGNRQKHSGKFSAIDARNLNNHFVVLDDIFVKMATECLTSAGGK